MASPSSPPRPPSSPAHRSLRHSTSTRSRPPSAPPPSIPLPPLPPLANAKSLRTSTSSPQLPPLPPLPALIAPSPSMPSLRGASPRVGEVTEEEEEDEEDEEEEEEEGGGEASRGKTVGWSAAAAERGRKEALEALESPASSHFSTATSTSATSAATGRETVSTRPSSADSGPFPSQNLDKFTAGTIPLPSSSISPPTSSTSPSLPTPRPTSLPTPSSPPLDDDSPSSPDSPRQRLERSKSVTVDGFDFDFVTPHLAPAAFSSFAPPSLPLPPIPSRQVSGSGSSAPDTPIAAGEASTPRALVGGEEEDCGCDSLPPLSPGSPSSSPEEEEDYDVEDEDDDYNEEAERILAEAGLGGLGLGLLRRQSEALGLVRAAGQGQGQGRGSVSLRQQEEEARRDWEKERGEGRKMDRSTTPPGAPPTPTVMLGSVGGSAAAKLVRRRKEQEAKRREREEKKERRKSKQDFERDRFSLPTRGEIEAAKKCELVGEGGGRVTFEQLVRERRKRVVVIFLRHAWCGLCAQFVEALTKAHRNLDELAHSSTAPPSLRASVSSSSAGGDPTPTISSGSPTVPPLYVLLISNGSSTLIPTYRSRLETPFPLYMDRSRKLYKALGMTRKTWDMGSDKEKGSYIVKSQMGNITSSISAGVSMPHYPGSQTQLGGEFVFHYDDESDEIKCNYAARMVTTRGHSEIRDIFAAAGVELSDADAASVYGGK